MSRTGFHKLRITADNPFDIGVELDDHPVHVRRLTLELDCQAVTEVTLTFDVDRILDLIDTGLQHSHEPAMPLAPPGRCTRCQHHPADADSDFCDGCRAFLLGDSDQDPKTSPAALFSFDQVISDEALISMQEQFSTVLHDVITPTIQSIVDLCESIRATMPNIDEPIYVTADELAAPRRDASTRVPSDWLTGDLRFFGRPVVVTIPGDKCMNDDFSVLAFNGQIVGAELRARPTDGGATA